MTKWWELYSFSTVANLNLFFLTLLSWPGHLIQCPKKVGYSSILVLSLILEWLSTFFSTKYSVCYRFINLWKFNSVHCLDFFHLWSDWGSLTFFIVVNFILYKVKINLSFLEWGISVLRMIESVCSIFDLGCLNFCLWGRLTWHFPFFVLSLSDVNIKSNLLVL